MLLQAFSIYDRKGLLYHTPFFAVNDATAIRMVTDLVADANTSVGRHPSDYVLFAVGTYSDQNGSLEPSLPLRHVVDVQALVRLDAPLFPGPFSEQRPVVLTNPPAPASNGKA